MSTIVYQSPISCFESQLEEPTMLKMKLAMVESNNAASDQNTNENLETASSWDFLDMSLSKVVSSTRPPHEAMENSYVHKTYSSSFSRLSGTRLDLCTENLGSETGTYDDITDGTTIFSLSEDFSQQEMKCSKSTTTRKTMSTSSEHRNFPPPLTTMMTSTSLQIRPHREQGRLIIKAVEVPSRHSFLAERSNGRLRLSFYKQCDTDQLIMNTQQQNESDTKLDNEIESDSNSNNGDNEELENEETESEQEEEDDNNEYDDEACELKMGVEMEMEKFQRLCSRCNQGTKGLCNWKSAFWVATS